MIPERYVDCLVQAKKYYAKFSKEDAIKKILFVADDGPGEWGTNFFSDVSGLWAIMDASTDFLDGVPAIKSATNRMMFGILLTGIWDMIPDTMPADPTDTTPPTDGTARAPYQDQTIAGVENPDGPSGLSNAGLESRVYYPGGNFLDKSKSVWLWGCKKVGDWYQVWAWNTPNFQWCYPAEWVK